MNVVVYIHGKDGSASESKHYKPLFSGKCSFWMRGLRLEVARPVEFLFVGAPKTRQKHQKKNPN